MSSRLQVNVTNNTQMPNTFILFQRDSYGGSSQVFSTVWLSQRLYPNSQGQFQWEQVYNFVSGDTGQLMPGVQFSPSEMIKTDPNTNNAIQFGNNGRGIGFFNQKSQPGGRFMINADTTVPPQGQYSVGMGMSNSPTLITTARPNMNYQFSPTTEYWIAVGNYQLGEILDPYLQNAGRIVFPNGVTKMNVVLNMNNYFTITPA
jgi:rhizosphere induced protein